VLLLLLIAACRFHLGALGANVAFAPVSRVYLTPLINKSRLEEIATATRKAWGYDPLAAQYPFSLARAETFQGRQQEAVSHYTSALAREPMACDFTQFFALYLQGIDQGTAGRLMEASVSYDRTSPSCYQRYATYMLSQNQRDKAVASLGQAMALEAERMNDYSAIAEIMKLSHEEFLRLLPKRVGAYLGYAGLLEKQGRVEEAEEIYHSAIGLIDKEPAPLAWHYNGLCSLLIKQKRYEEALVLLNRAVQQIPADAGLHRRLADLYRRLGITYRAQEEDILARTLKH
jgi:tetratricopeptide (TPR) repeat protein